MSVQLISIEPADKAVRFTELGTQHGGIVWTIQPGDEVALQNAIDMVNAYGGPNCWRVETCEPEGVDMDAPAGYAHAARLAALR